MSQSTTIILWVMDNLDILWVMDNTISLKENKQNYPLKETHPSELIQTLLCNKASVLDNLWNCMI